MRIFVVFAILTFLSCSSEKVKEKKEKYEESFNEKIEFGSIDTIENKEDTTGFFVFLLKFKGIDRKEIDENERIKFLKLKWTESEKENMVSGCISEKVLFESKKYIGLVYTILCRAGSACETNYLSIFNKKSELVETFTIGYSYGDFGFSNKMEYELIDSKTIRLSIVEIKNDDEGKESERNTRTETISIAKYSDN